MKYIFLHDIHYMIQKQRKFLLVYLVILLSYFYFHIFRGVRSVDVVYYDTLAVRFDWISSGWLEKLVFLFMVTFYIYITFQLFYKDLKFGLDNIYLRMTSSQWLVSKLITIYFISALLLMIAHIFFNLLSLLENISVPFHILLYCKNVLYIFCVESTSLLFVFIGRKYLWLMPILICSFLGIFLVLPTNIWKMSFLVLFMLFMLINLFLIYMYKSVHVRLIESC